MYQQGMYRYFLECGVVRGGGWAGECHGVRAAVLSVLGSARHRSRRAEGAVVASRTRSLGQRGLAVEGGRAGVLREGIGRAVGGEAAILHLRGGGAIGPRRTHTLRARTSRAVRAQGT